MRFLLGTHLPGWLTKTSAAPLFVSDRRLRRYKTLPRARGVWALDSGGFSELQQYGSWGHGPTPREYAARVRRYRDEIGGLLWAAPQDWMCEPLIIHGGTAGGTRFAGTGLSVAEHQRRTVANLLELRDVAPDLPFIPVLQGHTAADYLTCVDLYYDAGINLAAEPLVGVGSVCRRQATTEAADIIHTIRAAVPNIRLHGFGIKTSGLAHYGAHLASADSMAWSYAARRSPRLPECTGHKNCANCARFAFRWRERVLASLAGHTTSTQRPAAELSTKLDSPYAARLALAAFRDDLARLERDTTIRQAHTAGGLSVRHIAALTGLSPARVGQLLTTPAPPLLAEIHALRTRWRVDQDPATQAAANHIVANLAAHEDADPSTPQPMSRTPERKRRSR